MKQWIEDYINGNLADAKRRAKRSSFERLAVDLMEHGYSVRSARAIAAFLKDRGSFQAACDAEHFDKIASGAV